MNRIHIAKTHLLSSFSLIFCITMCLVNTSIFGSENDVPSKTKSKLAEHRAVATIELRTIQNFCSNVFDDKNILATGSTFSPNLSNLEKQNRKTAEKVVQLVEEFRSYAERISSEQTEAKRKIIGDIRNSFILTLGTIRVGTDLLASAKKYLSFMQTFQDPSASENPQSILNYHGVNYIKADRLTKENKMWLNKLLKAFDNGIFEEVFFRRYVGSNTTSIGRPTEGLSFVIRKINGENTMVFPANALNKQLSIDLHQKFLDLGWVEFTTPPEHLAEESRMVIVTPHLLAILDFLLERTGMPYDYYEIGVR